MLVENRPLWPLNLNAQGGAVHIISSAGVAPARQHPSSTGLTFNAKGGIRFNAI